MTVALLSLILHYSYLYHVDPYLVESVITVESGWDKNAVGPVGEIGLMQLNPRYFHYPPASLKASELNIKLGIQHLAKMKRECPFKQHNAYVVCYNLGVTGAARLRNPYHFIYYRQVQSVYRKVLSNVETITLQDDL